MLRAARGIARDGTHRPCPQASLESATGTGTGVAEPNGNVPAAPLSQPEPPAASDPHLDGPGAGETVAASPLAGAVPATETTPLVDDRAASPEFGGSDHPSEGGDRHREAMHAVTSLLNHIAGLHNDVDAISQVWRATDGADPANCSLCTRPCTG